VLKCLHEKGCPWDSYACSAAAEEGDLLVLIYAHDEKGCPWNKATCACAAQEGHLEVLKYARDNGCPEVSFDDDFD